MKKIFGFFLAILLSVSFARAQTADVTIQLTEPFFEAVLDSMFKNSEPPEFPLAFNSSDFQLPTSVFQNIGFMRQATKTDQKIQCRETIKLQRQMDGTKTAVRFRNGQISAPIAFSGNYNPPLIGCIDFSGVAETLINLEYDENKQTLVGRARVTSVNMSGTGGVGSGVLARMVQNSIDKKVNPINILATDKISFAVPIQNGGTVRMKATNVRPEIQNGFLNVIISYQFQ
ncbi:MAG TPA: hypothetical protein PKE69_04075 [Pyrinomonadaceae bacterium]|nr:hypothetical protein [Pyrinomonadaceae bacterium]